MTERARISSEHRDKRNQPAPDEARGHRKRDTNRWCRGKVGAEHDYQPFDKVHFGGTRCELRLRYAKCSKCGREEWGEKARRLICESGNGAKLI